MHAPDSILLRTGGSGVHELYVITYIQFMTVCLHHHHGTAFK